MAIIRQVEARKGHFEQHTLDKQRDSAKLVSFSEVQPHIGVGEFIIRKNKVTSENRSKYIHLSIETELRIVSRKFI